MPENLIEGANESAGRAKNSAGSFLSRPLGPLPLWVWAVGGTVLVIVFLKMRPQGGPSPAVLPSEPASPKGIAPQATPGRPSTSPPGMPQTAAPASPQESPFPPPAVRPARTAAESSPVPPAVPIVAPAAHVPAGPSVTPAPVVSASPLSAPGIPAGAKVLVPASGPAAGIPMSVSPIGGLPASPPAGISFTQPSPSAPVNMTATSPVSRPIAILPSGGGGGPTGNIGPAGIAEVNRRYNESAEGIAWNKYLADLLESGKDTP